MIEFLLGLSMFQGLILTIGTIALSGHLVYLSMHKLVRPYFEKSHEKIGRVLFRTSAGLLAFLISLNYANYRLSYLQIEDSLEAEAAQIVDIYIALRMMGTHDALDARADVEAYIQSIIDNEWSEVSEKPFTSETMMKFGKMHQKILALKVESDYQQNIKKSLMEDLDNVSDYMQVRVYKTSIKFPFLLYIVFVGMLFIYAFYTVYKPDFVSILFLTLYNIFIAMIVYFVVAMSNPLVGPLKIEPTPFQIIMEKGIKEVKENPVY